MSDFGDNVKYKWTPESTTLLVSVWTDKQVQKQLEYAQRPQLIWESVARYMKKKGYSVSAKQCRSRMKQVLVCYREAKRAGTRAGVEQYYDSIDKVLKSKRMEQNDLNSVDTVDSAAILKSPPKDVKTNKNLRMRYKFEPIESLIQTNALTPVWHLAHDEDYPDSPESNETVLAQPYRTFSPTRDAATNTLHGHSQMLVKGARRSLPAEEQPIRESRPLNSMPSNRYGEMLLQNTVQNVQNQIIQENMQQRNLQNQFIQEEPLVQSEPVYRRSTGQNPFYSIDDVVPSKLRGGPQRLDIGTANNQPMTENMIRMQNQLQQNCMIDNRAVPQEPQRGNFGQNLAMNYKLYKEAPASGCFPDQNQMGPRQRITNYSPDMAVNLNEAFCQPQKDERNHNLNDSYEQPMDNDIIRGMNATTITNNATFNDDTLSIEFLEGSPSPSDNGAAAPKSVSGNSDKVPNAPVRKKKVQKLEQLMLSAITSQNEVVNKILAAQDAMVSRFLDLDRDRQNRLENRMDHLINVVHATVNKSPDSEPKPSVTPPPQEPLITNLDPPPRPGVIPPKLDLVPPKPCRVPCTAANSNVELVNQNVVQTRPGVVSPVKAPGAIWSKLGPVSQSPFVKAQQQLGLRLTANGDTRTQSSAERRIAREMSNLRMDTKCLILETVRFIDIERELEEQIENARILSKMGQDVAARRQLFTARSEPNAGMILTAAFLDAERCAASADLAPITTTSGRTGSASSTDDDEELLVLARQVEKYERLRRLNMETQMRNGPCDTSTPAKPSTHPHKMEDNERETHHVPKQTIQQLAELVMKSARWRHQGFNSNANNHMRNQINDDVLSGSNIPAQRDYRNTAPMNNNNNEVIKKAPDVGDQRRSYANEIAERESRNKAIGWLQDRYSYSGNNKPVPSNHTYPPRQATAPYEGPALPDVPVQHPVGFTKEYLNTHGHNEILPLPIFENRIGFNQDVLTSNNYGRRSVGFIDAEAQQNAIEKTRQSTYSRRRRQAPNPPQQQQYSENDCGQLSTLPLMHRNMIDRYVQDARGPVIQKQNDKAQQDSDDEDEFLDTTATMQPSRKDSLTSDGTSYGKGAKTDAVHCIIS